MPSALATASCASCRSWAQVQTSTRSPSILTSAAGGSIGAWGQVRHDVLGLDDASGSGERTIGIADLTPPSASTARTAHTAPTSRCAETDVAAARRSGSAQSATTAVSRPTRPATAAGRSPPARFRTAARPCVRGADSQL